MDPPQGKSSPPTQEQDAMGDHAPIQEQVPHVPDQDRGSSNQFYLSNKYLLHAFLVYRVNIVYVA